MKTDGGRSLHVGAFIKVDDKFLVVLRKGDFYAGMLGLPGGHVEQGEDYSQALEREVLEETGYPVEVVDKKPVIGGEISTRSFSIQLDIYRARIVGEKQESDDEEVQEVMWVEADRFIKSLEEHSYPANEVGKIKSFLKEEGLL